MVLGLDGIKIYSCLTSIIITYLLLPIQMSHWRHTMVDGVEFWFSCQWLRIPRKASRWKLIQNLAQSTIVWRQCEIWIAKYKNDWKVCHLLFSELCRRSSKNRNDQPAFMFYRNLVLRDTRFKALVEGFLMPRYQFAIKKVFFWSTILSYLIVWCKNTAD